MLDILLVDDEPSIREAYSEALRREGHSVVAATDGAAALCALAARSFDLVIADVRVPGVSGLELFKRTRAQSPRTRFIMMTGYARVEDAVSVMKDGALDYLAKPIALGELLDRLEPIAKERALIAQLEQARSTPRRTDGLVGRSPSIARVLNLIARFAPAEDIVLITGETGTGKELVAQELHRQSRRRAGPFVAINCAAFPEALLEAELFGHERGAFTGATVRREGRFSAAAGGTLFLDEVAEMSLSAQAKLLRVLQEGTFQRLGSNRTERADARILAASHRDLKQGIAEGTFREDLYFRLKVLPLPVPSLRERKDDLVALVEHFLRGDGSGPAREITGRALAAIERYDFPGNVRELEHALRYAFAVADTETVDINHLPAEMVVAGGDVKGQPRLLPEAMRAFEREYLKQAVARAGGKRIRAAQLLGISRKSLWEKMRAYGLSSELAAPPSARPAFKVA